MTNLFECPTCELNIVVDFRTCVENLARANNGDNEVWWKPRRSWALIQADMVEGLWRRGDRLCDRHAALIAAMAISTMQAMCYEAAGVKAGQVIRKDRELVAAPFEQLGRTRHIEVMINHVRAVVERDPRVGALVEVDADHLRLRVTMTVVDEDGAWTAKVPMSQLGLTADVAQVVRAAG